MQVHLFVSILAFAFTHPATAQKPFKVFFEKPAYSASDQSPFSASILLDPFPAKRLFSYGLLVQIEGSNGLVGTGVVVPVKQFDFNGPLDPPALAGDAIGVAAVKGTSDFFRNTLPPLVKKTLATLTLDPLPAGDYTLTLLPYRTLGVQEQLFVRGDLGVSDGQITFGTATLHVAQVPGTISPIGGLAADPQNNGLLTQKLHLTNTLTRTPNGIRVWIDNVPAIVTVWNAFGKVNGRPYVDYLPPLAPGQSVDLSIQFFPRDRKTIPKPIYVLEEINPPNVLPPIGPTQPIQPRLTLANGYNLLEFSTRGGTTYYVQYSADLQMWKTAQPAVTGTGSRVQWIDDGPPRTESRPNQGIVRFYRIVLSQ
jgi:hypothetical protein